MQTQHAESTQTSGFVNVFRDRNGDFHIGTTIIPDREIAKEAAVEVEMSDLGMEHVFAFEVVNGKTRVSHD